MDLFNHIRSQRKLTILLVTHDPVVADCADRVIHMRDGQLRTEAETAPAARALRSWAHGANQPGAADTGHAAERGTSIE